MQMEALRAKEYCSPYINSLCHFYVVSPHGAGMQSFIYYLKSAEMHCTPWWVSSEERLKYDIYIYLREYHKHNAKYIGIVNDSAEKTTENFLFTYNIPVFWLVRDPVALLTSCINQNIGDYSRGLSWNRSATMRKKDISEQIEEYCIRSPYQYFMYSSQVNKIACPSSLIVIDTNDLLPDKINATMQSVFKMFHTTSCLSDSELKISYNNFYNRSFIFVSPLNISFHREPGADVYFCPEALYNFHFSMWDASYIKLYTVDIYGTEYCVFCRQNMYEKINYILKKNLRRIQEYINDELYLLNIFKDIYDKNSVKKEQVIDTIKNNKKFHDAFKFLYDTEVPFLEELKPGHTAQWEYCNALL